MKNILKTKEYGNLIVISGPSGAGKDTIVEKVLKENKNVFLSVSATSRNIRPGEVDGVNYYFYSKEEFEQKIEENEFLEYATYNNNYYGTPKSKVKKMLEKGKDVILVIEIEGALKIKKLIPDTIFIFIMPPSMKELKSRLLNRKTDNIDSIINRFKRAYQEINEVTKYNYVVVNDNLEDAVTKVNSIIISERCMTTRIEEVYLGNQEEEMHELLVKKNLINEKMDI